MKGDNQNCRFFPLALSLLFSCAQLGIAKSKIPIPSNLPASSFWWLLMLMLMLVLVLVRAQKGETPDSKSRALQQLAQDFGSQCNSIAKSLGKKGGEADAAAGYDKATTILAQYLKGVELDPLGSEAYK